MLQIVAVILENAGWGVTAAPVARHLSDFYLLKLSQAEPVALNKSSQSENPLLIQNTQKQSKRNSVQAAFIAAQEQKTPVQAASIPHTASVPSMKVAP